MRLYEIFNKRKLFHISFRNDLEGEWQPKIPNSDDKQKNDISEPDFPRICVSPSIEQCFQAIYPNVSQYFEELHYPNMDFYVYSPILQGDERILSPNDLTKKRLVHDAYLTHEYDILSPVYMKMIGKVRIFNCEKNEFLKYHPFDDILKPERDFAPSHIKWEWLI